MKYIIIIKGTWEHTEHPYPNYHAAFKAYDNFITLYSRVKGVTITMFIGEDNERRLMQQISF